jgi:hypothetical protein
MGMNMSVKSVFAVTVAGQTGELENAARDWRENCVNLHCQIE